MRENQIVTKSSISKSTICFRKCRTTFASALMQSQSGSIHSPHRMRKIIMKEWKKSVKFHLGEKERVSESDQTQFIFEHFFGFTFFGLMVQPFFLY